MPKSDQDKLSCTTEESTSPEAYPDRFRQICYSPFKSKYEITIDIILLKQNFPHLTRFADRLMLDLYNLRGIAPFEITIPKEFLYGASPKLKRGCTCSVKSELSGQIILIKDVLSAFKENGYSHYDQYYFYRERLGVRSLFELFEFDLKGLLSLLSRT